ncbi:MAG: serine hydrolase domain-containing protein [Candidatus Bathyarchaeia archaeon]
MSEAQFEKLESIVVDLMRQAKVPGLSISVVIDGKPAYAKGFGARNLEKNLPMTPDTLWGIASISKSFCAMAVMQLVENGKIDLNAPVRKYINFKLGKKGKPITIHHLLCHSSGIPELDATTAATVKEAFIPMSSEEDFLRFVNKANTEIFSDPGEMFMYNNDMYTCLGLVVQKVAKMRYEDYVKKNILKPLQMNRSTFIKEEFEKDDNIITGYVLSKDGKSMELKPIKNDRLDYACGGLYSSVRELQNYMIMLMNGGEFNGHQLLEKSSIEKMWTPYIKPPAAYAHGDGGYGYGWSIEKEFFGYKLVQHGGNIPTSGGFLAMVPEKKLGIALGQIPNPSIIHEAIVRGLLAILLGEDMDKAAPIIGIQKKLERIIGKYKTYGMVQGEISMEDGILYLTLIFEGESKPVKLPLLIKDIEKLKFSIPALLPEHEMDVQIITDEKTGKVHMQIDRYYFHKIA